MLAAHDGSGGNSPDTATPPRPLEWRRRRDSRAEPGSCADPTAATRGSNASSTSPPSARSTMTTAEPSTNASDARVNATTKPSSPSHAKARDVLWAVLNSRTPFQTGFQGSPLTEPLGCPLLLPGRYLQSSSCYRVRAAKRRTGRQPAASRSTAFRPSDGGWAARICILRPSYRRYCFFVSIAARYRMAPCLGIHTQQV